MPADKSTHARISKRTVDAVPKPPTGEARLWDTEIKGFFLRVYPSDRRVYALKAYVKLFIVLIDYGNRVAVVDVSHLAFDNELYIIGYRRRLSDRRL